MAAIIRILLRYGAGILVARGLLLPDDASAIYSDPEIVIGIETAIGAGMAALSEAWYWLARKFGWAK